MTLASGATSAVIPLTPVDNTSIEPSESVTLTLTSGTGYTVGTPSTATGTIADNNGTKTVVIRRLKERSASG